MNIEITLDKNLLNDKDMDFFHYGYGYELAKCEYGTWRINSLGELKCHYLDEEKGIDTYNYYDIINYYVRNNDELVKATDSGKLYIDLGNWFSIEFFDNNGNFIENSYFGDSVYGSISEGLRDFEYQINNYLYEIKETIKDNLVEQLEYLEKRLDYVGYGKSELYEIEDLKAQIEELESEL